MSWNSKKIGKPQFSTDQSGHGVKGTIPFCTLRRSAMIQDIVREARVVLKNFEA